MYNGISTRALKAHLSIKNSSSKSPYYSLLSSGKAELANTSSHEHLFQYTSGRWLYDEQLQLERRYVKFNVEALRNIASASTVLGALCTRVTKLPEGFYNKLRNVLDIPVPEVVAWSSSPPSGCPTTNSVGAEYMLMRRVKGRQLRDVWESMSEAQRFGLVKNVVAIEAKLARVNMPGYGNLYYKDCYPDVMAMTADTVASPELRADSIIGKFVLGPSTDRLFWVDRRGALEIDRGPWKTAADYLSAIAKREIACIRNHITNEPCLLNFGQKDSAARTAHIHLLEQLLTVIPHILPPPPQICRPVLLHHDLHMDNIFVDSADPTNISGIIDWQATSTAPLFMQARFPSVFDCEDPYPWGAVQPQLPDDFDSLSEQEKAEVNEQHDRIRLKKFYELASRKFNPDIPRAMDAMRNDDDPTSFIFHLLGQTAVNEPIPLQELLIQIYEKWDLICARRGLEKEKHNPACPFSYTPEEISRHRQTAQLWAEAYNEFSNFLAQVGGKDGWVSHDEFEEALRDFNERKGMLQELRMKVDEVLYVF